MRIRLDLREVSNDQNADCFIWMYVDCSSILTVGDLLQKIKSDCELQADLRIEDLDLYLEQFLLPQKGSIKLIKDSELITPKTRENKKSKDPRSINIINKSLSNKVEKSSTGTDQLLLVPYAGAESTSASSATHSGLKSNLIGKSDSFKQSQKEKSQSSNITVSPETIRSIEASKHKHVLLSRLNLSENRSYSPSTISDQNCNTGTNSSTKNMNIFRNVRRNCYKDLVESLQDYGKPWKVEQKYEDFMSFQCGTPDNLWIYAWTPSLAMIDDIVQVKMLMHIFG